MLAALAATLSFVLSRNFLLCLALFSPLFYVLLNSIVPALLGPQDLKKKYNAKWALVTGSSSGIGKELARKLLLQGLDVILVAREEKLFNETVAELKSQFSERQVVQVNANLSDESGKWMDGVKAAVGEKSVQVIFLNAGYILTGMFEANTVGAQLANLHCNLTANVHLAHFFYSARRSPHSAPHARSTTRALGCVWVDLRRSFLVSGRLLAAGERGCIVFTSSSGKTHPAISRGSPTTSNDLPRLPTISRQCVAL